MWWAVKTFHIDVVVGSQDIPYRRGGEQSRHSIQTCMHNVYLSEEWTLCIIVPNRWVASPRAAVTCAWAWNKTVFIAHRQCLTLKLFFVLVC